MASRLRPTPTDSAVRRAGFTIMELMIVLVIIGIMAMTVAPSLSEVLSNNRQSNAAMELVKFARNARSRAVSLGAAQLVRYQADGSRGHGRLDLFSGANNKCLQTPWADAIARGPKRSMSYDALDYNQGANPSADDQGRPVIRLSARSDVDLTDFQLCYQPDGLVYAAYGALGALRIQNLDIEVTIRRTINGVVHGANRMVVFPMGGNARLR